MSVGHTGRRDLHLSSGSNIWSPTSWRRTKTAFANDSDYPIASHRKSWTVLSWGRDRRIFEAHLLGADGLVRERSSLSSTNRRKRKYKVYIKERREREQFKIIKTMDERLRQIAKGFRERCGESSPAMECFGSFTSCTRIHFEYAAI